MKKAPLRERETNEKKTTFNKEVKTQFSEESAEVKGFSAPVVEGTPRNHQSFEVTRI